MSQHLDLAFSDNEIIAKEKDDRVFFLISKESITVVFVIWGLLDKKKRLNSQFRPLGLQNPNGGIGVYAWIFVNDIRLDLASHTIVADTCVIPLSKQNLVKLAPALERLFEIGPSIINTLDVEVKTSTCSGRTMSYLEAPSDL